jgi:ElaB/YqjD/DUF883 family membrane-anchored ribosome-binding protein
MHMARKSFTIGIESRTARDRNVNQGDSRMAETSHEIRRQIDDTRARIGTTIAALEHKMNPRRVVDEHPLTLVGVAFGTGLLLSTTGATGRAVKEVREQVKEGAGRINTTAGSALDEIINAVIGAATATITSKMTELLQVAVGGSNRKTGKPGSIVRAA